MSSPAYLNFKFILILPLTPSLNKRRGKKSLSFQERDLG
jgi:hypothetical protein